MISRIMIYFLVLLLYAETALAAGVAQATVEHEGGVYRVAFEVLLDADPDRVREIVNDYERLSELTPTVVHSKVISRDSGRTRLDLLLKTCVWKVFCRSMRKVTDATTMQDGSIRHRTVASESDFSYAEEHLWIHAGVDHQHTVARYQAELVPKFFIPPLIGPWLVRRQIIYELTDTAQQIERVANQ